jgi:hypothetical protein
VITGGVPGTHARAPSHTSGAQTFLHFIRHARAWAELGPRARPLQELDPRHGVLCAVLGDEPAADALGLEQERAGVGVRDVREAELRGRHNDGLSARRSRF